jgi:hypothetical protein
MYVFIYLSFCQYNKSDKVVSITNALLFDNRKTICVYVNTADSRGNIPRISSILGHVTKMKLILYVMLLTAVKC